MFAAETTDERILKKAPGYCCVCCMWRNERGTGRRHGLSCKRQKLDDEVALQVAEPAHSLASFGSSREVDTDALALPASAERRGSTASVSRLAGEVQGLAAHAAEVLQTARCEQHYDTWQSSWTVHSWGGSGGWWVDAGWSESWSSTTRWVSTSSDAQSSTSQALVVAAARVIVDAAQRST